MLIVPILVLCFFLGVCVFRKPDEDETPLVTFVVNFSISGAASVVTFALSPMIFCVIFYVLPMAGICAVGYGFVFVLKNLRFKNEY